MDKKNCQILQMLHKDCRTSLTKIAQEVSLSVDAVNKRIKKMKEQKIFAPTILLRHRYCGFNNVIEVKIKLQNFDDVAEHERFINYLKEFPPVTEVFSTAGEWDLTMVFIARNAIEQGEITRTIRTRFGKIINAWSESLTITAHKFEDYSFEKLFLKGGGGENA